MNETVVPQNNNSQYSSVLIAAYAPNSSVWQAAREALLFCLALLVKHAPALPLTAVTAAASGSCLFVARSAVVLYVLCLCV